MVKKMVNSMTGFASTEWLSDGFSFSLEMKSVNARGLDIRLRFPEGFEALEAKFKTNLSSTLNRGNISLNLRIDSGKTTEKFQINRDFLKSVLSSQEVIHEEAKVRGIPLVASKASDYMKIKGILNSTDFTSASFEKTSETISIKFNKLLKEFLRSRFLEGAELKNILSKNLNRISDLLSGTENILEKRQVKFKSKLKTNLKKIIENVDQLDQNRVAQELALITVKYDVSEEVDRLRSHAKTTKKLINLGSPCGRKLDFLLQEFNREANTLCSKSNDIGLTEIGLELKVVIDQLREQVQNVE